MLEQEGYVLLLAPHVGEKIKYFCAGWDDLNGISSKISIRNDIFLSRRY
jgi:hypothetical protein